MTNSTSLRARLAALTIAAAAAVTAGCTSLGAGDDTYRPQVGQPGKDVMWVPTLDALVIPMLEAAAVGPADLVYDLGSGDGKIPIYAARRYGARAVGIEYDPELSALAQRNAERAGVTDRVRMIRGDLFKHDFTDATVLTLYLGNELNQRLRPIILSKMRPGTRVVSNAFDMGTWQPDRVIRLPDQNPVFFWVVPARAAGEWEVTGLPGTATATLTLTQTFQFVEGSLASAGRRIAKASGRLEGTRLTLELAGESGAPRSFVAEVGPDTMKLSAPTGSGPGATARRLR